DEYQIKYLSLSVGSRRISKGLCLQAITSAASQAFLIDTPPSGIAVRQSLNLITSIPYTISLTNTFAIRWKPQAYIRIRAESIARAARQALLIETPPKGIAVRQSERSSPQVDYS